MEIESALRLTTVVARLHPDERMRTTAEELGQALAARRASLALRPDIYSSLRAIDLGSADPATRRYVTRELRDLELAGVNKPEPVRTRLTQLRTELQAAQQEFSRNLLNGQRRISASASEIEGLPPDFVAARKPDASGSITLTTDDVDMQVVSTYARNAALRKRHLIERFNVAAPGNVNVLERLLAIRYEIATLLGYPMWAEYHARSRMAGDAKTVADFIDKVFAASSPAATREYAELLARKKQDIPDATTLESWDRTYYAELVRRARYSFDSQSVRPYFPYERVRAGVMDVSSRLFGVTFRPAPHLPAWHSSVETYEVLQGGTLIGRLYLDVHPRAQKANSGASVASVRRGAKGVHVPEAVLTASVPGGVPGDPGLMTHDQVRTMFHEFGHVIHAIVGGQGRWHGINGIDIEGDVAEAPSTMLEEWIWDAPTLATFARHYQTNEPIPAGLVKQMRQAGEFGRGLDSQREAFFSKVSLSLHDKTQSVVDSTAVVRDVSLKYNSLYPWVGRDLFPGTVHASLERPLHQQLLHVSLVASGGKRLVQSVRPDESAGSLSRAALPRYGSRSRRIEASDRSDWRLSWPAVQLRRVRAVVERRGRKRDELAAIADSGRYREVGDSVAAAAIRVSAHLRQLDSTRIHSERRTTQGQPMRRVISRDISNA